MVEDPDSSDYIRPRVGVRWRKGTLSSPIPDCSTESDKVALRHSTLDYIIHERINDVDMCSLSLVKSFYDK